MNDQPVIFFDGVCNLCNASVQFVIRHDPKAIFKFCSLQSPIAKSLLPQHHFQNKDFSSFILLEDGIIYTRSTAALRVIRRLKSPFKILYGFIIVPPFIRNWAYKIIANNRYNWFGKKDTCMVPDSSLAHRFLN